MLRSTVDDKFLTVHRERFKLCLAEPFHEQDVQHVEAEPTAPDIVQPPQPLHVPQPPINKIAPPPAQPLGLPEANPLVSAAQAVQLLHGAPVQAAAAINPSPFNCRQCRNCYQQTQMIRAQMADRNVRPVHLTV